MKFKRPKWAENSPHAYGLLSMPDVLFLENLLQQIATHERRLEMLEIGVANGATMYGIYEWCERHGVPFRWTGIDMPGYGPDPLPPNCTFIPGKSEHVYVQVQGEFNFLFVDGNHDSNHVCLDFLNYSQYLKPRSWVAFHDTNESPKWVGLAHPDTHQGDGPMHPDFGIGVRFGLKKLGLLEGLRKDWQFLSEQKEGDVQGMMVFRKL